MNSCPEVNVFASIPAERTSRLIARQTDSSSSTMAMSGLVFFVTHLFFTRDREPKDNLRFDCTRWTLAKSEGPVYWTLVQYRMGGGANAGRLELWETGTME